MLYNRTKQSDCGGLPVFKARAAINRPPLAGLERHGSLPSALGAIHPKLCARGPASGEITLPLGLARTAAFGRVLKPFFGEELLLPGSENKLLPAAYAGENFVLEIHPDPHSRATMLQQQKAAAPPDRRRTNHGIPFSSSCEHASGPVPL